MASFLTLFGVVVDFCFWIIIIQVILSWLINFDVQVWQGLNRITEPVYRPIRRMLPDMGGIDIAPMIVLFGLYALQVVVYNNLGPLAYGG
jgi:YggT family protein